MTILHKDDGNSIDKTAALWVVRNARGLSHIEKAEFDLWRQADPKHSGSYLRALAIDRLARTSAHADIPDMPVHTGAEEGNIVPDSPMPRQGVMTRRRMGALAFATSIAAVIGLGAYWHMQPERMSTGRGEIRNIAMTDGSTAILGTESTIRVAMGGERRSIEIKNGQAWFEVAHDRNRPFEVRHGDMLVRATGTAFEVGVLPQGMEVIVTEGSVLVLKDGVTTPIAHLKAGNRMSYSAGVRQVETLDSMAIRHRMSWREGMIILDGKRLIDAVAEVNRYNMTPIRITNPSLEDQRVFGTFRARDPEGLARALAIALNAQVVLNDEEIEIK